MQISGEGSQHFSSGGSFSLLRRIHPTTCAAKSCSAGDGISSGSGSTSSPPAWWSALPRVHENTSQLASPLPLRSSLLGVGVLTLFGAHHLVRVMSGRKSSLSGPPRSGRLQGRAFGRGSERSGEGAEGGTMRLVVLLPPPREAAPCTPGDEALHLRRVLAVSQGIEAVKAKSWGLRVALRGPCVAEREVSILQPSSAVLAAQVSPLGCNVAPCCLTCCIPAPGLSSWPRGTC